jgi:hypothetical protein
VTSERSNVTLAAATLAAAPDVTFRDALDLNGNAEEV